MKDVDLCLILFSVQVVECLEIPTLDHEMPGLNPARGRLQLMTVWHFIAQSLSLSSFHHFNMT